MKIVLSLILLLFASSGVYAQTAQINRIDVVQYGLYTADKERVLAPSAQGVGYNKVTNIRHSVTTRTVPMQQGVQFGFEYNIIGSPGGAPVTLRFVVRYPHPGVRPPQSDKPILSAEVTVTKTIGKTGYLSYSLDSPWELIPGVWTLELWYGDRQLASQSFTLVKQ